ncbi:MAG TPA: hypothetical protein VK694_02755 [Verrucomicrobiae bacterium]|nr:hypothetical protein [Verrucomicrobiae bacterium]
MDQLEHASFFTAEDTAGEPQAPETTHFSELRVDARPESIDLAHQKELMRAAGIVIGVSNG